MPVRIRITALFTLTVVVILLVVEVAVYCISSQSRINFIKTRLTNRAVNIASMFNRTEVFNNHLIQQIDTSTSVSVRDKEIQVYDSRNKKIYSYSDRIADTLRIDSALLDDARQNGTLYFIAGKKEAIALYDERSHLVIVSATFDEPGKKYLRQLKIILCISLLGGIVISLAGGYFFSGKLLQPITHIADEVNEISAGSLVKRIRTSSTKDEWHYLADTLNQLLNRLQQSFNMQRRFIANASHELSTPLTSISNQLEVSLQRNRDAAQYRDVMESVHQDVQHINKLTQTLLECAKASGDDGGLEIGPLRIDEIILQLPAELAKINAAYVVEPEFDNLPANQSQLLTLGNEDLLFIAVKNIVLNACKYSPDHHARVRLQVASEVLSIEVIDAGQGIPESELENIFQPFYRTNQATGMPGFGLGLSLARQIIQLHKGAISVSSPLGTGTSFLITLPSLT